MNILKAIQLNNPGKACRQCVHFQNDPKYIEQVYPGLSSMSSGYASIRDGDGICDHHQVYLSEKDSCSAFSARNGRGEF